MVSMRVFCCLVMVFILQLHAKVCNANFNSQVPKAATSEGLGANIITHTANMAIDQDLIENRKTLKHVYVNVEATEKNGFEIESKETVRRRENKRLAKTVSLNADYSDPGHHPPRHN